MPFNLFARKDIPLAALAACPACKCDVFVRVLVAYRLAGERREVAGDVCECVQCGQRVTVLTSGGMIAYGRQRAAVSSQPVPGRAAVPGGEATEGGGSLFGDMVTNLDDPRF